MSRQVLIYLDEGVGPRAFRQLFVSLHVELAPSLFSIKAVGHRYLTQESWESKTDLLVIPGGRDVFYHSFLKGEGNRRIASFVSNGGKYLGLCAGGYYGASYIEFEKGGKLEVCGKRELAFFPGHAIGPAYGFGLFSYENENGARTAHLNWEGGESYVYFNGGCFFANPEAYPGVEVLARYRDLPNAPAAVVRCAVGAGQAILCGSHPEFEMEASLEPQRRTFWQHLLNKILT